MGAVPLPDGMGPGAAVVCSSLVCVAAALAGCSVPQEDYVGSAAECSDAIKRASRPDGTPYGTFDHSLRNDLTAAMDVTVEHLHASGCGLGAVRAVLDPDIVLAIEYAPHLWDAAERTVTWNGDTVRTGVDWACAWDYALTPDGLADREDMRVCA